jgi:hypothetical protein
MTVDVNDPRAINLEMRSGEKETVKSDIVVPQTPKRSRKNMWRCSPDPSR